MAIKANLLIDQGADFSTIITVTDDNGTAVNLSGYTGAAQMRKHYTSPTAYSFTVTVSNSSSGEVTLAVNSSYSNTIPAGRYVYDCELTDGSGIKSRLVEGIATITPQVTR